MDHLKRGKQATSTQPNFNGVPVDAETLARLATPDKVMAEVKIYPRQLVITPEIAKHMLGWETEAEYQDRFLRYSPSTLLETIHFRFSHEDRPHIVKAPACHLLLKHGKIFDADAKHRNTWRYVRLGHGESGRPVEWKTRVICWRLACRLDCHEINKLRNELVQGAVQANVWPEIIRIDDRRHLLSCANVLAAIVVSGFSISAVVGIGSPCGGHDDGRWPTDKPHDHRRGNRLEEILDAERAIVNSVNIEHQQRMREQITDLRSRWPGKVLLLKTPAGSLMAYGEDAEIVGMMSGQEPSQRDSFDTAYIIVRLPEVNSLLRALAKQRIPTVVVERLGTASEQPARYSATPVDEAIATIDNQNETCQGEDRIVRHVYAPDRWSELFPDGRHIFYEGTDPDGFRDEVKAKFGFDPAENNPRWGCLVRDGDDQFRSYSFHCPAIHLNEIYGSGQYKMGS